MELPFGYMYMAASTSLYFTRRALLHHSLTPRELGTVETVDCHVSSEPSWGRGVEEGSHIRNSQPGLMKKATKLALLAPIMNQATKRSTTIMNSI
jgi:hypothetical protein